ncbi:hypothetical protein QR98_0097250 [Sarcoptes scabiei]|uniref:Uncharacterized protein n=1 Tax=Sarcoptes scabiei TaxID=52283 RepID=A0A132AJR1_SARSC|nr:hypothetical protein QR98_0097250 [Sarcoptes scabiei]
MMLPIRKITSMMVMRIWNIETKSIKKIMFVIEVSMVSIVIQIIMWI